MHFALQCKNMLAEIVKLLLHVSNQSLNVTFFELNYERPSDKRTYSGYLAEDALAANRNLKVRENRVLVVWGSEFRGILFTKAELTWDAIVSLPADHQRTQLCPLWNDGNGSIFKNGGEPMGTLEICEEYSESKEKTESPDNMNLFAVISVF